MYTIREAIESFVRKLQSDITPNVELINRSDLHETIKIPGIIVQGPEIQENLTRYTPPGVTKEFIIDEPNLTFEARKYPHFFHLDFDLICTCNTSAELIDLQEKIIKFFTFNSMLAVNVDDNIHLHEIIPVGGLNRPNLSNLRQATGRYRLEDIIVYSGDLENGKLIKDRIFEMMDLESEKLIETVTKIG